MNPRVALRRLLKVIKRLHTILLPCIFFVSAIVVRSQEVSAPQPQTGSITGTATDVAFGVVPGATVTLDGPTPADQHVVTANDNGFFVFHDLPPALAYRLTIDAKGFAERKLPAITLQPGEQRDLSDVTLQLSGVETTVTAVLPDQLALEQVQVEEKQRVLGLIPNFYTVYDHGAVPLTVKLKFNLAIRASTDAATIAGAAFIAGVDQASDGTPHYQQGLKGYGQRFGASYADAVSGILVGGAILPSVLHQDPRYFYEGEGTTKSRFMHAISTPFVAKGDNGRWQFNYSSTGGDLISGALSNLYYPDQDRGAGLVFAVMA